jgi:hypothetical protein
MLDRSFQLLRTNPRLTTNIKMVISSDDKLYLESFNTNKQLGNQKYKHYQLDRESTYEYSLTKFFLGLPSQLAFDVKYDNDNQIVNSTYDKQFDDMYWSGAKSVEDNWYSESFEYFAPLYIKKDKIPDAFVILRVDDPIPYEERDNHFVTTELKRDNFNKQIVDKWKCVSLIDLRYQSNVGYYMFNNITDNDRFPATPFEIDFREYDFSKWYGIDYNAGVYAIKSKYMTDILKLEQPHFKLEKQITDGYRDNNLVFPNIWNMKFLFEDKPATPDRFRNYSINRYYGFYVDDLDFVTNLTSYITPTVKDGVTLINNIFVSGTTEMIETPFEEEFDVTKGYYIYIDNFFHEVVKVLNDGKYVYKLIADEDLHDVDFTKSNDRVCYISYQEGNYSCMTYDNPSGYTNYINGYTDEFVIDPYNVANTNTDPTIYDKKDMYADLYLILIDGIYHILKKRGNEYFIQTDYAINSYPTQLQYWKGGESPVTKVITEYGEFPLVYPVYRIKFSDIRDFDFDKVDSKFSDFDYEKDTYYVTAEEKLYTPEYTDNSIEKKHKIHPRGEYGQYKVMNISSEYVADDELYEIKLNNLTEIWRKNSYINKWGFLGSNSHSDYPYKLNNSVSTGDIYNRTSDVLSLIPDETSKNLDYFYIIGNTVSGDTKVRYLNQSIHIETDLMDQSFSEKFNLEMYMVSDVDYFDYFFRNETYYESNGQNYIKPTHKYAIFEGGDKYTKSATLFKGINFNVMGLSNIGRDSGNKILNYITNKNTYNGYKFAIILNDVYKYYSLPVAVGGLERGINDSELIGTPTREVDLKFVIENGLQNNNLIDTNVNGVHIFLNEKYKNILCIINSKMLLDVDRFSGKTFSDVSLFGEKNGFYYSKDLNGAYTITDSDQLSNYIPEMLTASNLINSINDMNELNAYESGITYYYINSDAITGSTGSMNEYNPDNTMTLVNGWNENFPPFILSCNYPETVYTKAKSYNKNALKGPKTNIYNLYSTIYNNKSKQNLQISDPLAREMSINLEQDMRRTIKFGGKLLGKNVVYRYNGKYEPIFKTIPLFQPSYIYNSSTNLDTGVEYSSFSNNYKFEYNYAKFGLIDEVIFSKVNPTVNPLKLKNSTADKSIYPMVDEFGYQFSSRFIFSSSWDKNFYVITKPEQVTKPKKNIITTSVPANNTPAF